MEWFVVGPEKQSVVDQRVRQALADLRAEREAEFEVIRRASSATKARAEEEALWTSTREAEAIDHAAAIRHVNDGIARLGHGHDDFIFDLDLLARLYARLGPDLFLSAAVGEWLAALVRTAKGPEPSTVEQLRPSEIEGRLYIEDAGPTADERREARNATRALKLLFDAIRDSVRPRRGVDWFAVREAQRSFDAIKGPHVRAKRKRLLEKLAARMGIAASSLRHYIGRARARVKSPRKPES